MRSHLRTRSVVHQIIIACCVMLSVVHETQAMPGASEGALGAAQSAPTTVTLTSTVNPALTTMPPVLIATIGVLDGVAPQGWVEFLRGGVRFGIAPVYQQDGQFIAEMGGVTLGLAGSPHAITAQYLGDAHFAASTSAVLMQEVVPGTYTFVNIGSFGGSLTTVVGMNDAGHVIGTSTTANSLSYGFVYSNGVLTQLSLGGSGSTVVAINAAGQVAGDANTADDSLQHSFIYTAGSVQDLDAASTLSSTARTINESGQVGVTVNLANGHQRGFVFSDGVMTDLGSLGGSSTDATALNAAGQVVGSAALPGDATHAFRYSGGTMADLGTLGGTHSSGTFINDAGDVVGVSTVAGDASSHAFRYRGGVMTDLGTLGGASVRPTALNAAGLVAGNADTAVVNATHGFLFDGTGLIDLGTLGGSQSGALRINAAGQVAGSSLTAGDVSQRAYLYSNGGMTDLGTLGGTSSAFHINRAAQVVGVSRTGSNTTRRSFVSTSEGLVDLDAFVSGRGGSTPVISDAGHVALATSVSDAPARTETFLLTPARVMAGSDVRVPASGGVLSFGTLLVPGATTMTAVDPAALGASVPGFVVDGSSLAYEVATTAVFAGNLTVCFNARSLSDSDFAAATILHRVGADWVAEPTTRNDDARMVCAVVSSLSPFVIARTTDTTAPVVSCAAPDGLWHSVDVLLSCSASDGESGLSNPADVGFSLATAAAPGTESANEPTSVRNVCDVVGNCATAGPIGGNRIDKKPPMISIATPDRAVFLLHQQVPAEYSCSDGGSGLAACTGPVRSGQPLPTGSVGIKPFPVAARDRVGHSAARSVAYGVAYAIKALYDQTKPFIRGNPIQIKMQLTDAAGRNVSNANIVVSVIGLRRISPNPAGPLPTGSNTKFRFDNGLAGYVHSLATSGLTPGTYQLMFSAGADPTSHSLLFRVK